MTVINNNLQIIYNETLLIKIGDELGFQLLMEDAEPMNLKIKTFKENNPEDKSNNIQIRGQQNHGEVSLYDLNEKRENGNILNMNFGQSNNKKVFLSLNFEVLASESLRLHVQVSKEK